MPETECKNLFPRGKWKRKRYDAQSDLFGEFPPLLEFPPLFLPRRHPAHRMSLQGTRQCLKSIRESERARSSKHRRKASEARTSDSATHRTPCGSEPLSQKYYPRGEASRVRAARGRGSGGTEVPGDFGRGNECDWLSRCGNSLERVSTAVQEARAICGEIARSAPLGGTQASEVSEARTQRRGNAEARRNRGERTHTVNKHSLDPRTRQVGLSAGVVLRLGLRPGLSRDQTRSRPLETARDAHLPARTRAHSKRSRGRSLSLSL